MKVVALVLLLGLASLLLPGVTAQEAPRIPATMTLSLVPPTTPVPPEGGELGFEVVYKPQVPVATTVTVAFESLPGPVGRDWWVDPFVEVDVVVDPVTGEGRAVGSIEIRPSSGEGPDALVPTPVSVVATTYGSDLTAAATVTAEAELEAAWVSRLGGTTFLRDVHVPEEGGTAATTSKVYNEGNGAVLVDVLVKEVTTGCSARQASALPLARGEGDALNLIVTCAPEWPGSATVALEIVQRLAVDPERAAPPIATDFYVRIPSSGSGAVLEIDTGPGIMPPEGLDVPAVGPALTLVGCIVLALVRRPRSR